MNAHYFTDEKAGKPYLIKAHVRGEDVEFYSAPGLFSKERLDNGTKLLLESAQLPAQGSVLDLGCGSGSIGVLIKKWHPNLLVTQSDVTEKALAVTEQNAAHFGVHTRVVRSDCYDAFPGEQFSTILVNPPRAAGKDIIFRMIQEAPPHITSGGTLQLVAMTNKGGSSYEKMMQQSFGNVEVIGRGGGFKVYKSKKR
jgi:16S rRNA (guanine1207-N2)-methyltransferase